MVSNFQRTNYFILLAFGAMLIGFAPIFVKWSMLSSSAIAFYRMFLAIPFLLIVNYAINKRLSFKVNNKSTIFYTALASVAFTTDLTLWHFSMTITSVSNATIIVNSAPIFVAVLSFIIFKEKLSKGFFFSFVITYGGIIGLIYFSNNYINGKFLGDLLCLIAAFFSASSGSIGLLMQPITATLLAAILFSENEKLNGTQVIFIFVAMIGISLARINLSEKQSKQP